VSDFGRGLVTVNEEDFRTLSSAALELYDLGQRELAYRIDDLARKANAAISRNAVNPLASMGRHISLKTSEIESPLECAGKRKSKLERTKAVDNGNH
jgi:hypothetical protein